MIRILLWFIGIYFACAMIYLVIVLIRLSAEWAFGTLANGLERGMATKRGRYVLGSVAISTVGLGFMFYNWPETRPWNPIVKMVEEHERQELSRMGDAIEKADQERRKRRQQEFERSQQIAKPTPVAPPALADHNRGKMYRYVLPDGWVVYSYISPDQRDRFLASPEYRAALRNHPGYPPDWQPKIRP